MTGAPIPAGADAFVMQEACSVDGSMVSVRSSRRASIEPLLISALGAFGRQTLNFSFWPKLTVRGTAGIPSAFRGTSTVPTCRATYVVLTLICSCADLPGLWDWRGNGASQLAEHLVENCAHAERRGWGDIARVLIDRSSALRKDLFKLPQALRQRRRIMLPFACFNPGTWAGAWFVTDNAKKSIINTAHLRKEICILISHSN